MTIRIIHDIGDKTLVLCAAAIALAGACLMAGAKINDGYADYRVAREAARADAAECELATATDAVIQAQSAITEALTFTGVASWYGTGGEHGRIGANGKRFDMHKLTAAAKRLPFGSRWKVTRLDTRESVIVEITDHCPRADRLLDLSWAAAKKLGMIREGVVQVKIQPEY